MSSTLLRLALRTCRHSASTGTALPAAVPSPPSDRAQRQKNTNQQLRRHATAAFSSSSAGGGRDGNARDGDGDGDGGGDVDPWSSFPRSHPRSSPGDGRTRDRRRASAEGGGARDRQRRASAEGGGARDRQRRQAPPASPSSPHPTGCPCVLCAQGSGGAKVDEDDGTRAIYARLGGEVVYTGIVRRPDGTYFKLDDASVPDLDGPGHVMDESEFLTELYHYDDPGGDGETKTSSSAPRPPFPIPIRTDVKLMDFHRSADRPNYVEDLLGYEYDPQFDEEYPFATVLDYPNASYRDPDAPKSVRALDAVMVVSPGRGGRCEAFWSTVVSVTSTGTVTAECRADVPTAGLGEGDWIAFPLCHVLGVRRGPNWPREKVRRRWEK